LGISAAWSLARRGWSVDVLEARDAVGHPLAGSKGDARIFRLGYPEPHYVAMASAARTLWRDLEAQSGRRLLHVTGQLSFGDPATMEALAGSLADHEHAVEPMTRHEAEARFPGVVLPGPALFERQSGVLAADECLRALMETAPFEMQAHTRVTLLQDDDDEGEGVTVHCADGRAIRSDVVVDCAGPDALTLLGGPAPQVGAPPSLPQVAYFAPARSGGVDPARLPVFIEWDATMVYGLPVLGSGRHAGTFKVSHHTPGPPLHDYDPAAKPPAALGADDPAHLRTLTDAVRRILPGLDPEPVATERCVYDNSADTDFVLDRVGNIVVGCGTSGHAFKFGPLLGELLADLAAGTTPRLDLSPFRIDRMDRSDQDASTAH
jgi:glycine/D-amino acid oxidase-like deaminating enzyme